jgi:hypothetical protein
MRLVSLFVKHHKPAISAMRVLNGQSLLWRDRHRSGKLPAIDF